MQEELETKTGQEETGQKEARQKGGGKFVRRMLRIFVTQWPLLALAVVTAVLQCAAELFLPRVMAEVVNDGVLRSNQEVVQTGITRMLIASAVMAVCGFTTSMCSAVTSQRYARSMRDRLYSHIGTLSVQQVDDLGTGSVVTRLTSDVSNCASLMNVLIMLFLDPLILLFGGVWMMIRISGTIGLIFGGFVLSQVFVMVFFMRKTAPRYGKLQNLMDTINQKILSTYSNLRLVKMFTLEPRESARYTGENDNLKEQSLNVQKLVAIFNPIIMLLMNLSIAVILLVSGFQVQDGSMQIGNLLAAITYSEQILLSVMISGQLMSFFAAAQPSSQRICEVLDTEGEMTGGEAALPKAGSLRAEDVTFAYPDCSPVLEHVSLETVPGELLAILGCCGSGKSTLADLLCRLADPLSGRITYGGVDLRDAEMPKVRSDIALAEKQAAVMDGTFRDNIRFGRDWIPDSDVDRAARIAQCAYIMGREKGMDEHIASMGVSISGGERQRLIIARALADHPSVLILDDSTSSLDYATEENLLRDIRSACPDMTVILITQRLPSARKAERIAFLTDHRILDTGTDQELMDRCGEYRRFCLSQQEDLPAGAVLAGGDAE